MRHDDHEQRPDDKARRAGAEPPEVTCPFCRSGDVELIALFGGQLSTDQYYCRACRTYFERFARDAEGTQPS